MKIISKLDFKKKLKTIKKIIIKKNERTKSTKPKQPKKY